MVAHSICQDGIGFPYLSPVCYWYFTGGEEKALQFASIVDIPSDSALLISQINEAKDEDELGRIAQSDLAVDVFQRCGITQILKPSTKDVIGQEIVSFDSVGRISKLLDQICSGLQTLGVLPMVRAFPELFIPLFTYTACVSPADVIEAVYVDQDLSASDKLTMAHLHKFIGESSEEELKRFLLHSTGSIFPRRNTVRVEFSEADEYGTISAHTCDQVLMFPKGLFSSEESYSTFKESLMAVIDANTGMTFNMV